MIPRIWGERPHGRLPIALYPVWSLVLVVVFFYVSVPVSPFAIGRAMIVVIAIGLLLTAAATKVARDRDVGALVAWLIAMAFIAGVWPPLALPMILLALVIVADARRQAEKRLQLPWPRVTSIWTAAIAIALLAALIKGVQEGRALQTVYDISQEVRLPTAIPTVADTRDAVPDVYLILLDGYLRPDKQRELFGGDASAFVAALEDRDFDVATASRSNYPLTWLSLVSMLNMRQVPEVAHEGRRGALPELDPRYLINESEAIDAVRDAGYEVVGISAGWEELALRQADWFIDPGPVNEVEYGLLLKSAARPLLDEFAPSLIGDAWRARIEGTYGALVSVAESRSHRPRLVLAHVPSPHAPFVFGPNGEHTAGFAMADLVREASPEGLGRDAYARAYLGQVRHLDELTISAVEQIVNADPQAVVVLFSDHGSASEGVQWSEDPASADLDERTAILVAVRSPGHRRLLPGDVTLVNVLAPIFNAYIGTNYPLAPNTIYEWHGRGLLDLTPARAVFR